MNGPLVVKLHSIVSRPAIVLNEMVIVLEIDVASDSVLMQRETGEIEIHKLSDIKLIGDMKFTRLSMPAGPPLHH